MISLTLDQAEAAKALLTLPERVLARDLARRGDADSLAVLLLLKLNLDATLVPDAPSQETGAACRYPAHRAEGDWRSDSGRVHCRVCHPPAPHAER